MSELHANPKTQFRLPSRYLTKYSHFREETVDIKNRNTSKEEVVISGLIIVTAEDGYKYFVHYMADGNGSNVTIEPTLINRIPLNTLKSLVG